MIKFIDESVVFWLRSVKLMGRDFSYCLGGYVCVESKGKRIFS